MIRLPVLQQLYNLSDDALEYQLLDRPVSCALPDWKRSGRVPDAKTIWVWRERLKKQDLISGISEAVGHQLANAGFIARGGQIIDISIMSAPVQYNRGEENDAVKQGDVPEDWSAAKRAQKDVDALDEEARQELLRL